MHFFTILELATSATAGVAGGRKPSRPLWNQRGPVRAGHNFEQTAGFVEKTHNLARDARDAVQARLPFNNDEVQDGPVDTGPWSRISAGLKDAWNAVTHGVNQKAHEAAELAKAHATMSTDAGNNKSPKLALRDVDDEAEAMHNILERAEVHGEVYRAGTGKKSHRPASYRLGQRDLDVDEDEMPEYDGSVESRDAAPFDEDDDAYDDEDELQDSDADEDHLAGDEVFDEEEAPPEQPEEDTTRTLSARDADPARRRLFHLGRKPKPKLANPFHARDVEDEDGDDDIEEEEDLAERDFLDGTKPIVSSETAGAAPPPQPAHQTNGWGRQHGHYRHAEPPLQAGPGKTRSENEKRFLSLG
ncbi:hypothetical protein M409DRAFT_22521 [Zasmidium cellare ATCC 36951]|uniref:Uncharacterized protein n=1 Tax=Zasmidium cellare ATCC 36951 TaxID=1080233 RepID=A0A6A6CIJ4_ZASCE|nr:uncharacterized protein M409DRAFT_22521 [Zasmidium cellare ATCC 36951]KAF2167087.1 hypothetical protein M409DRAFT_22521 [Zasmidium cellare ATCC 36951]